MRGKFFFSLINKMKKEEDSRESGRVILRMTSTQKSRQ